MLSRTDPFWLKATVTGTWIVLMGSVAYGLLFLRSDRMEPRVEHPQAAPTLIASNQPAHTPTSLAMSAPFLYQAGVEHMEQGDYDSAIEEFTKAIELDPMNATYYGSRAHGHIKTGIPHKAINDYSEALALDPDNAKFHLGRAVAYIHRGDRIRAIEDLEKVLEIAPNHSQRAEIEEQIDILRSRSRE